MIRLTSDIPIFVKINPDRLKRRKGYRQRLIESALLENDILNGPNEEKLIQELLEGGWGKLAHCITRQLKSPGRYGLKLVHIALIMTIYDRTIAKVKTPRMFAAITLEEFKEETGMDGSNLRTALKELESKGVVKKVAYQHKINFWGLSGSYFQQVSKNSELPKGKLPVVKMPLVEKGNLPVSNRWQNTRSDFELTHDFEKEIFASKNLLQESKKESLSCGSNVPQSMITRWKYLDEKGKSRLVSREKKIFHEMVKIYGDEFAANCANVLAFLEREGTGKDGPKGVIHDPMLWIRDYWETNFLRYLSSKAQVTSSTNDAKVLRVVSSEYFPKSHSEVQTVESEIEQEVQNFLDNLGNQEAQEKWIRAIMLEVTDPFLVNSWNRFGLRSPLLRSYLYFQYLHPDG